MKKNILLLISVIFIALCFSGCFVVNFGEFNPVEGKGSAESFIINVDEYNKIKVNGFCEIRYHSAPSNTVTLEVQPNLREYFVVETVNGELIVRTTRRINPGYDKNTSPVLIVSAPVLNSLNISGAGTFNTYDKIVTDSFSIKLAGAGKGDINLEVNNLFVDISGAGSIEFSGVADTADFSISGAGDIKALSLQTRETNIDLAGASTIRISCSDSLNINAGGMGNVEYRGSPSINQKTGGMVNIRRLN